MHTLIIGASHALYLSQALGTFNASWEQAYSSLIDITSDRPGPHQFLFLNPKTEFLKFVQINGQVGVEFNQVIHAVRAYNRPDAKVILQIGGNEHASLFFLQHDVPFDFYHPQVSGFEPGRQIIPAHVVRAKLEQSLTFVAHCMAVLSHELREADKVYIAPPPPIPSLAHIQQYPEVFDLHKHTVEAASIRLKQYLVMTELLAGICARNQVRFMAAPPEQVDEQGFLREAYWNHCTHATPDYYHRVLDAV